MAIWPDGIWRRLFLFHALFFFFPLFSVRFFPFFLCRGQRSMFEWRQCITASGACTGCLVAGASVGRCPSQVISPSAFCLLSDFWFLILCWFRFRFLISERFQLLAFGGFSFDSDVRTSCIASRTAQDIWKTSVSNGPPVFPAALCKQSAKHTQDGIF